MASETYPPGPPSINGDIISTNRFLKDTPLVARALRTIEQEQLVSDRLLTGQSYTESGSVQYEQDEGIYADREPRAIAPGGEYPLTPIAAGDVQQASTVKWGQDAEITDESVNRRRNNPVGRALRKLVNSSVLKIDGIAMSAIASAVTQNTAAAAVWVSGTPNILRDVMKAQAQLQKLKIGLKPDTIWVDLDVFAAVASDEKLMALFAREMPGAGSSPVQAGLDSPFVKRVGGLTWVTSPVAPITNAAFVLDSSRLGEFVDELLPAPGYVRATGPGGRPVGMTQVKTIRDDDNDRWRVRARRITVPVITEPRAAWKITGVAS
ncbi:phage major capsid protein [Mycolicibacterium gilvum]|uniref:phage major capsid protein n=1 Tax=Mycolicibacterium gilvum TaxID=1804 RepID=UPI004046743A